MALEIKDTIQASLRNETGKKGYARRLRASGSIPANAYGPTADNQNLQIPLKDLLATFEAYGAHHIYNVKVEGGKDFRAMVRDVEKDYFRNKIQHVDFLVVDDKIAIRRKVPLTLTGRATGVVKGGVMTQATRFIPIEAKPKDLPEKIELDVSDLDLSGKLRLSDLKLPKGVTCTASQDWAIVLMSGAKKA